MTAQPDLSKLPAWARNLIAKLQADNAGMEKQLREIMNKDETALAHWEYAGKIYGLPKHGTVSFKFDNGDIKVGYYNGMLRVIGYAHQISIEPVAANSFYVRVIE